MSQPLKAASQKQIEGRHATTITEYKVKTSKQQCCALVYQPRFVNFPVNNSPDKPSTSIPSHLPPLSLVDDHITHNNKEFEIIDSNFVNTACLKYVDTVLRGEIH